MARYDSQIKKPQREVGAPKELSCQMSYKHRRAKH